MSSSTFSFFDVAERNLSGVDDDCAEQRFVAYRSPTATRKRGGHCGRWRGLIDHRHAGLARCALPRIGGRLDLNAATAGIGRDERDGDRPGLPRLEWNVFLGIGILFPFDHAL